MPPENEKQQKRVPGKERAKRFGGIGGIDRAEKRLRMRAVDSFWRVFDRLINEILPP